MIHYTLVCEAEHSFEGWFRSSADFDTQATLSLVSCPVCGSTAIGRGVMAPNVVHGKAKGGPVEATERDAPQGGDAAVKRDEAAGRQSVMMPDQTQKAMLETLREIRKKVTENATYVGDRFAEEARKMHYGDAEHQGIYGEATREEVTSLADEGIEFQALPALPEERN